MVGDNIKLKIAGMVIALSTVFTSSVMGVHAVLERIDANTLEIRHTKELHDKDIEALKLYHRLKESNCRDYRDNVDERLDALEELSDDCKEKCDDTE